MKNEVKRKMTMQTVKSLYQSHDERTSITKVNKNFSRPRQITTRSLHFGGEQHSSIVSTIEIPSQPVARLSLSRAAMLRASNSSFAHL